MSGPDRVSVVIRPESHDDHEAIRSVTAHAFAGHPHSDGSEPKIIDALRDTGALVLSLVALHGDRIIGHVAFSPVGPPAVRDWFALGPVAVDPALQRRGVGSQLIDAGLQQLRARGAGGCVLLGDHRYYRRFGFVVAPDLAPPDYPAEHFQILAFGASRPDRRVAFHAAFEGDWA